MEDWNEKERLNETRRSVEGLAHALPNTEKAKRRSESAPGGDKKTGPIRKTVGESMLQAVGAPITRAKAGLINTRPWVSPDGPLRLRST
jgi:hypothetical protein